MRQKQEIIESLIKKYERYVAPLTFISGFLLDILTLQRIDFWIDHIILLGYLGLAAGGILAINAYEAGKLRFRFHESLIPFVPIIVQFGFGGLFSAFIIFYVRGASVAKSWIFLFALAAFLVGNERFRKRYQRIIFQLTVFSIAVFSYSIFAVPIILGEISERVFLVSELAGAVIVIGFTVLVFYLAPADFRRHIRAALASMGAVFALFTIFYFLNIIPPAPLALKESGIYHSVVQNGNIFEVRYEPAPRYLIFQETSLTYHWRPGERVYFFSAVFAPTRLTAKVFHQWSHYNEERGAWVRDEKIPFTVVGGRDRGYRGYSFKTAVAPGKWRVEVVTQTGQVLGRETFRIIESDEPPLLFTQEK